MRFQPLSLLYVYKKNLDIIYHD